MRTSYRWIVGLRVNNGPRRHIAEQYQFDSESEAIAFMKDQKDPEIETALTYGSLISFADTTKIVGPEAR